MAPEIEDRLLRAEDLPSLRREGPYELVEGRIVPTPLAGKSHGNVVGRANRLLSHWASQAGRGMVTSGETGYLVRRDPDTVRAPDLAWLSPETLRRGEESAETFYPCAPDLAIEVLSPDDSWEAVEKKVREYLNAGAKGVWVLSPTLEKAYVYEPGRAGRALGAGDVLDGGDALPGFRADVREFFTGP